MSQRPLSSRPARPVALLVVALLVVAVGLPGRAGADDLIGPAEAQTAAGSQGEVSPAVLVRWMDGTSAAARDEVVAGSLVGLADDAFRTRVTATIDAIELVGPGGTGFDRPGARDAFIDALTADPRVKLVELDREVAIGSASQAAPAPNDPLFTSQWGLNNTGTAPGPSGSVEGTAGVDVRILEAWSVTTGSASVSVGVIDTLIDTSHPDLAGAVVSQVSTIDGDGSPSFHGTAVAGVIAARADDGAGMAGVGPDLSIVSAAAFQTLGGSGTGNVTLSSVLAAIDAVVEAGADVINASWVAREPSPMLRDAIASTGVPVVAAAGNDSEVITADSNVFPVGFDLPNVVAVAAIDRSGQVADFSNVGADFVDIAAPGVEVVATTVDGQHVWAGGTSFAAPHVAAAIGMAASVAPYATTAELVDVVTWTSRVLPSLQDVTRTGGMLDVAAVVRGIQRPMCRPDLLPPSDFPDVQPTDTHAGSIDCIVMVDITTGRADGTFGPDAPITREQLATMLYRLLANADALVDAPESDFPDVSRDSVHIDGIDLLTHLDIVRGRDGLFDPKATVSRGQMASLLVRTYDHLTDDALPATRRWFEDTSTSTHREAIDRGRDLGIIRGVSRTAFDPSASTRRGQMASFLARQMDAIARYGQVAP